MKLNTFHLTVSTPTQTFKYNSTELSVKIGRSLQCDFNIPQEELSREHCLLEVKGENIYITDLASKNGITVDHIRIPTNTPTLITNNSIIVLSNTFKLKLNSLEVKTKADILHSPNLPKLDNTNYEYGLERARYEAVKYAPLRRPRREMPGEESISSPSSNYEFAKMIIAFLVITAAMLYHALGE